MCLQSWPLAGRVILLKVIGHFKETLIAVCSTLSSVAPPADEHNEKFLFTVDLYKRRKVNSQNIVPFHKENNDPPSGVKSGVNTQRTDL